MVKIKVINYETGESYEKKISSKTLNQDGILIGRLPSCDLILSSPDVSRVHGKIECLKGKYFYIDQDSTCGSQIKGEEVQPNRHYLLMPDDVIRIGDYILLLNEEVELNGNHRINRRPDRNGAQIDSTQSYEGGSSRNSGLNNGHSSQPSEYRSETDSTQNDLLILKVEDLEKQGIYQQGASAFRFQNRLLVEGLTISKSFRQDAVELSLEKLNAGSFCLLIEYSAHFTIWEEKFIKGPYRNTFRGA